MDLRGGYALEGGGADVTRVYTWMAEHAGKGDFLVLTADANGNYYNNYINKLMDSAHKLNSVATLGVATRAGANSSFVRDQLRNAEAIFIAGGDQSVYIN